MVRAAAGHPARWPAAWIAAALAIVLSAPAARGASPLDDLSPNLAHLANIPYTSGTDLAFFEHYAIAGDNGGSDAGFRIIDIADPASPKVVGHFHCLGSQNDVSVWGRLAFVSIDGRRTSDACDAPTGGTTEGVRVVDISNLARPKQIAFVQTDCGSHTHTLVPDPSHDRILLYVESYPFLARTPVDPNAGDPQCNQSRHDKVSVVEVPLAHPRSARVIATPSVAPALGCHDVTVFLARKLAAAACLNESQMWDISDPVHFKILAHIPSDVFKPIEVHHSAAFSWDGNTLAIGDEAGGALGPACATGHDPLGAIWFFDVTDPANPVLKGSFSLPRPRVIACTAHNFNVIPGIERDVLVSGFYRGGVAVVDFTDPSAPFEVAHGYLFGTDEGADGESDVWSAYWYDGAIYANDGTRGFDVFRLTDPEVAGAASLSRMNAQTQEAPAGPRTRPAPPRVLGGRKALPDTGVAKAPAAAVTLMILALALAVWTKRRARL
jgi:hypothetical protein